MEKVRCIAGTDVAPPSFGDVATLRAQGPWEIVCFVFPGCDGCCAHCWSSDTYLGRPVGFEWHERFWPHVDARQVKEVKLSGGETLLYKDLARVVGTIRRNTGAQVPITIFTSGRRYVSAQMGEAGVRATMDALDALGIVQSGVQIHLSVDEYHAPSLVHSLRIEDCAGMSCEVVAPMVRMSTHARNFLEACKRLQSTTSGFLGGKLKIHAAIGRMRYHRKQFAWLDDAGWATEVIATEGLVRSGRARSLDHAREIGPNGPRSMLIMPGATFGDNRLNRVSQQYRGMNGSVYLNPSDVDGVGAAVVGWWNLINKQYVGGSAYDVLSFIGKQNNA